jgi:hypothetical protein
LRFSLRILYKVLSDEATASVAVPSDEEIAEYMELIGINYPALQGAWCVMDGLKLLIQKSGDQSTQNVYYNGWLHDHFVGSVLAFVPSGKIVLCCLNAPGSWHDSFIAENGGIYNKLGRNSCTNRW